ncbi:hypothetical protein [Floridanema fluviatile]|uniref:hypothetical protein n=1 Tax=Floridanema fluviatile TaxID=3396171 RepID=UPI0039A48D84
MNQLIQWQNSSWLILTFCPKLKPDAQLVKNKQWVLFLKSIVLLAAIAPDLNLKSLGFSAFNICE